MGFSPGRPLPNASGHGVLGTARPGNAGVPPARGRSAAHPARETASARASRPHGGEAPGNENAGGTPAFPGRRARPSGSVGVDNISNPALPHHNQQLANSARNSGSSARMAEAWSGRRGSSAAKPRWARRSGAWRPRRRGLRRQWKQASRCRPATGPRQWRTDETHAAYPRASPRHRPHPRDYLFGGGYPNPARNAEQLSFLFFYMFEAADAARVRAACRPGAGVYTSVFDGEWPLRNPRNACAPGEGTVQRGALRWSSWTNALNGEGLVAWVREEVFPFYAEVGAGGVTDFMAGARLVIDEATVLSRVVSQMNDLYLEQVDADTKATSSSTCSARSGRRASSASSGRPARSSGPWSRSSIRASARPSTTRRPGPRPRRQLDREVVVRRCGRDPRCRLQPERGALPTTEPRAGRAPRPPRNPRRTQGRRARDPGGDRPARRSRAGGGGGMSARRVLVEELCGPLLPRPCR